MLPTAKHSPSTSNLLENAINFMSIVFVDHFGVKQGCFVKFAVDFSMIKNIKQTAVINIF